MNECKDLDFGVISIERFAKGIDKASSTIYSWIREGVMPSSCYKKIAGSYFIKTKNVIEWLESEG